MRVRGIEAHRAAHFLMKIMFSMFAEDIELLKNKIFKQVLQACAKPGTPNASSRLSTTLKSLFEAMATGGMFGAEEILHFNGGLFADADVIDLRVDEIEKLAFVNTLDWSNVEPSVFGTLFERILDPDKRSQIGAHYTSRDDILTLLEPVMMQPLRREWEEIKAKCEALVPKIQEEFRKRGKGGLSKAKDPKPLRDYNKHIEGFHERLTKVKVLDPACGSGNFLYVALNLLLDLEKEVITYASRFQSGLLPEVRPTQLAGIEINEYAHELASVVIWIGYLQWMYHNGFNPPSNPVLEPIETIKRMDAILDMSDPDHPKEPEWPSAEFIVGNPPFLGGKLMRSYLGSPYMESLFKVWDDRVRPEADLCCYWFEKAHNNINRDRVRRVGLLATQGIRGGANRETLKRIKETGDVFFAVSNREWILDGASVHVSLIGFDNGKEQERFLDGQRVPTINANLTASADVTQSRTLRANLSVGFMADTKGGAFDISDEEARHFLRLPNASLRPNSDVVVPWTNGLDLTRRPRSMWIIDFGVESTEQYASQFEEPFKYIREHVFPERRNNRRDSYRLKWWLHVEPRGGMREALSRHDRFITTAIVSKHRLFVWMALPVLPDHQLVAFARSDDYFFGVVHSKLHELWGLKLGTRLTTRPRYTATTCFETFSFPEPSDAQREAIAAAARELDQLRNNWLNPPEWTTTEVLEFPGTVGGPWDRYIDPATVEERKDPSASSKDPSPSPSPEYQGGGFKIGTVKYPRIVPKDEAIAKELKKRTLTNLYNERPTWLDLAHKKLDEAVFAAYGWSPAMSDDELLAKLLELNLKRAAAEEETK
jgi:type II restriction/modification system DNA methylase subunit YeeA